MIVVVYLRMVRVSFRSIGFSTHMFRFLILSTYSDFNHLRSEVIGFLLLVYFDNLRWFYMINFYILEHLLLIYFVWIYILVYILLSILLWFVCSLMDYLDVEGLLSLAPHLGLSHETLLLAPKANLWFWLWVWSRVGLWSVDLLVMVSYVHLLLHIICVWLLYA